MKRLVLGVRVHRTMFFTDGPKEVRCINWHLKPPSEGDYCAVCGSRFSEWPTPIRTALTTRWTEHFGPIQAPRDWKEFCVQNTRWLHVPSCGNEGPVVGLELRLENDGTQVSAPYYTYVADAEFTSGGFASMGRVLEFLVRMGLSAERVRLYLV